VHSEYQVGLLEAANVSPDFLWLKINTGMNRLGVRPEDASALIDRLRHCGDCNLGLMTHFANADDVTDPTTNDQMRRFLEIADHFDGDVSVANSAALLGWRSQITSPSLWNNTGDHWIRPGLSLYGVSPLVGKSAADLKLRSVMQFESTLIAINPVRKGDRVGYGGEWQAENDSVLGIVAAGYGDGYSRFLPSGTPVLVNGRPVPLAGVVSMDLCAVDLGPDARDSVGDPVMLWGEQLPVEEVARHADTIAYQLLCGVTNRDWDLS
jgi:alanine racemase